ncbi:phage head closure protein [Sporolactobacillus terrae]|uniref:Phage head-tail adapter protein n=1 Tax=Sporolactobacillus terrae TaxID=269673 RepID=A0A5K7WWV0_9BACL|nr:phage head closure protein [Sporolactobacillus terrae]BBN99161.1 hypothetical protein St703_18660 [Sporolactobacillus terrae]
MPSLKPSVGDNHNISLDDVCDLITVDTELDNLNQPVIKEEHPRQLFCARLNVSRAEFAAAGQLGLKPDLVLAVDSDEYDGENQIDYAGKRYAVYRDYLRTDGYTELYCEVKAGVHKNKPPD